MEQVRRGATQHTAAAVSKHRMAMGGRDIETIEAHACAAGAADLSSFVEDDASTDAMFVGDQDAQDAPAAVEGAVPLIAEDLEAPAEVGPMPPSPLALREKAGARVNSRDEDQAHLDDVPSPASKAEELPQLNTVAARARADLPSKSSSRRPSPATAAEGVSSLRVGPSLDDVAMPLPRARRPASRCGLVTIPLLCAGLLILACCLLLPQADANRQLAWGRLKLERDLASLRRQADVNDQFLQKVSDDPGLAQRLAERQLREVPQGTASLQLAADEWPAATPARRAGSRRIVSTVRSSAAVNAFTLTAIAPPDPLPAYRPSDDLLSRLCLQPGTQLYAIGAGLLLVAAGLVLGTGERTPSPGTPAEGRGEGDFASE